MVPGRRRAGGRSVRRSQCTAVRRTVVRLDAAVPRISGASVRLDASGTRRRGWSHRAPGRAGPALGGARPPE